MGRPTKMTESTLKKLQEAFLFGSSDSEACLYAGICRDTLYEYQKKNLEFSDKKEEWKSNPLLKARKTVFNNLDNPKVAMWYLERKSRNEFDLRQKNAVDEPTTFVISWRDDENKDDNIQN